MSDNTIAALSAQQQDENYIREARKTSNAAISKLDVAGVAQYWMDNIVVISGEGGQYAGKKLLMKVWKEMFAAQAVIFERLPSEIRIGEGGILAWEQGIWRCTNDPMHGNYAAMWRKINGKWMTQSELFVALD
ncbi:YybH family protein [Taibaiella chishuiensis]|uniref:Ketosteroid isomerase-like protein n=1 Tax=Taibaiella chishuiensis TaxID=1434707 RepID=A0A2P8CR19_9BACT|nr:DUF4440 domain-containing protein [Taibaiella chishuiensis]PSK87415.1 ketosteroid isomerase-like protein [Taibaiella chishuiensis]